MCGRGSMPGEVGRRRSWWPILGTSGEDVGWQREDVAAGPEAAAPCRIEGGHAKIAESAKCSSEAVVREADARRRESFRRVHLPLVARSLS